MPRPSADTRTEIRAAALELFAERGFEAASLREIAERIGITKAALYYHYASKEALLADLVGPMFTDVEALAESLEQHPVAPREALERFWDLSQRHRAVLSMVIRSATVVARAEIAPRMMRLRARIQATLAGDGPVDQVRAIVALGGLQDAAIIVEQDETAAVRGPAVDAAVRALGS